MNREREDRWDRDAIDRHRERIREIEEHLMGFLTYEYRSYRGRMKEEQVRELFDDLQRRYSCWTLLATHLYSRQISVDVRIRDLLRVGGPRVLDETRDEGRKDDGGVRGERER